MAFVVHMPTKVVVVKVVCETQYNA